MKKYLVTGGSGFIGRSVIKSLVERGNFVRVLDNDFRGSMESLSSVFEDIEFIKGDVRDLNVVKRSCKNIDCIIHLASVNGTKYFYSMPEVVLDVSTRGMLNVIDASLWHGVEELFFASSSEVYQAPKVVPTPENVPMVIPDVMNPRFSYAGGKIISELLIVNYGRRYFKRAIIFRPHNVYGPQMGWEHVIPQFIVRMKKLVENDKGSIEFLIQGSGDETRSFVYIDDFTRALNVILEKGKHLEIYNIGTSEEVKIRKIAQMVASYYRRKIKLVPGKMAKGGTPRRFPDISKIEELGYTPKVDLREGIFKTARWYNANIHKIPFVELI